MKNAKDAGYDTKQVEALLDRVQENGDSDSGAGASGAYKAALEKLSKAAAAEAEEEPISVAEAIGDKAGSENVDSDNAESQEADEATQGGVDSNLGAIAIGVLVAIAALAGILVYVRRNRGHE